MTLGELMRSRLIFLKPEQLPVSTGPSRNLFCIGYLTVRFFVKHVRASVLWALIAEEQQDLALPYLTPRHRNVSLQPKRVRGQRVSGCNRDTDSVTVTNMTIHTSPSSAPNGNMCRMCVCVCSTSNNSWSKGLKHVAALHACMSTIRLGMSAFLSHVREGLLNSVRFCSSHCECLCGEFGFALIPHHLRVHAVAPLKHISIFCEVRVSCGNIYLTFSLFGRQGLRAF